MITVKTILTDKIYIKLKRLKTFLFLPLGGILAHRLKYYVNLQGTSSVSVLLSVTCFLPYIRGLNAGNWYTYISERWWNWPPALLVTIFKVMKSVLNNLNGKYLMERQLASSHQHGFVKNRNYLTTVYDHQEECWCLFDDNCKVDVVSPNF